MEPADILDSARNVERFDRFSRRNYGLKTNSPPNGPLNLSVLENHAAVQIINKT